jgi:hypothetical protein
MPRPASRPGEILADELTAAEEKAGRDAEMKNIVLADATARDQAIRHFFGRALRE